MTTKTESESEQSTHFSFAAHWKMNQKIQKKSAKNSPALAIRTTSQLQMPKTIEFIQKPKKKKKKMEKWK